MPADVTIIARISGLPATDLESIVNLPERIETLVRTAGQTLDGIRNGSAQGNPAAAFIQSLGGLADDAGRLPQVAQLVQPVRELLNQLPGKNLVNISEVTGAIESALALFGPLKDAFASGGIERALEEAGAKALELAGNLNRTSPEFGEVVEGFNEFLRLFGSIAQWRTSAPNPQAVFEGLSQLVIGVPHDLLAGAASTLEAQLAPLGSLLPEGADLDRWRVAPQQLAGFWTRIDVRLSGPSIDWPALLSEVNAARTVLLEVAAARDRALAVSLSNLNRLQIPAFSAVSSSVFAIPRIDAPDLRGAVDGFVRLLREFGRELDRFQMTPEQARQGIREFVDSVIDMLNSSPLGRLRDMLITLQQRFLRAIESLPFAGLAHQVEAALDKVADAIERVDPRVIVKPVHDFLTEIGGRLDDLPRDQIREALAGVWEVVREAVDQISSLVESVRDLITAAIGAISQFVQNAQPAVQQITQQITTVKAQIEAFSLDDAADPVIEELQKLRDMVAELDVSQLPGPAVSLLKQGAEMLRQIDVTAAVSPPLEEQLNKLDPAAVLREVTASLTAVIEGVRSLDPASIAQRVDEPVNALLSALTQFGPEQMKRLIEEALAPLQELVRTLDFGTLLAPLSRLYAEVLAKVDAILNPDVIFQPLEQLYQPVLDFVDAIEPSRLVGLVAPHGNQAASKMAGAAGPPGGITAQTGVLQENITSFTDTGDALFGFRPGDVLVPLIDLHKRLTESVSGLSDEILAPAARLLKEQVLDRFEALKPVSIQARVNGAAGAVRATFDPGLITAQLSDALVAYHSVAARIEEAASLNLSDSDRALSVQVTAALPDLDPRRVVPERSQFQAVLTASVGIESRLEFGDLSSALAALGEWLDPLLTPLRREGESGAAMLRSLLADLDPAPIRTEINQLFDDLGRKLVGFQNTFVAAVDEMAKAAEEFLLPVSPMNVLLLAQKLHQAAREQVAALGPATFKDEVRRIFDVVKARLALLDPGQFAQELNALRERLLLSLASLADSLLPEQNPFDQLQVQLAGLKPSQLLAPLTAQTKPVSDLVLTLSPDALFQPLLDALEDIRSQVPEVIARIEAALDEVLAAFPEGGGSGARVEVSASFG